MTAYQIPALQTFSFKSEEWSTWLRRFERFRQATGLKEKSEETQISTLIYSMGDKAEDLLQTFSLSEEDAKKYSTVVEKFNSHFIKRCNVIYERARFNRRVQQEGESVEDFIFDVHTLAQHCAYGPLQEEMIRDRIVAGIRDASLSEKLQMDDRLTLETAVKKAQESEAVKQQQKMIRKDEAIEVDAVKKRTGKQPCYPKNAIRQHKTFSQSQKCTRCGQPAHAKKVPCPAKDQLCHRCDKKGHFKKMCRTKLPSRNIDATEEQNEFLGTIYVDTADANTTIPWVTPININMRVVNFKIDTGADVTVISEKEYDSAKDGPLTSASKTLNGPSQETLDVQGQFIAQLQRTDTKAKTTQEIYVVKGLTKPLLGRPAITALNLVAFVGNIQLQEVMEKFPTLFTGLGRLKDSYCIKLKQGAQPFALSAPRRIPIPLLPKVKQELDRMTKLGVITEVTEPTEWCAGMVIVPKPNGQVRICVDLTKLNVNICRERHILPSVETLLAQLGGAKHFSKLDANSGFWQIEMDPESSKLTTFITPFGRFKFNRLPFGITSAPEHFQRRMNQILAGMEGIVCLIDDILVYGRTQDEHDQRLLAVLKKIQDAGLTLNKDKCEFNTTSIKFLGQVVDSEGVKADPAKIRAILELKPPTNVKELRHLLGMANQLSKFSPNLAQETKPLRDLLSKKNQWTWGNPQEIAFTKLKQLLSSDQILALYNPALKTIVSADASAYGLGAVLRQCQSNGDLRPVAYISRALTETEQKYAQIEKEALAATWACERFQDYLIGLYFHLETDHKPLVPLLSTKNIDEMPLRIQRFRLRLMRYHYSISHVAGENLCTADTLSRAPLYDPDLQAEQFQQDIQAYVNLIVDHFPATDNKIKEIIQEQEQDTVCQKIKTFCQSGWPNKSDLERVLKPYAIVKHELTIVRGILLRGKRIVIPSKLQIDIVNRLHSGHQGISKCRQLAQENVWWPGIGKDIKNTILDCPVCCQYRSPGTEPLMPTELPERPWQKVATDLFEWEKSQYLLVVDYYSRFIEISKLSTASSPQVITHLKSIFARHGIPQTIVSDNGPQYSSDLFDKFSQEYGFVHVKSSPKYPQANGEAERAVRTIKNLLKKNQSQNSDMYLALLAYRSTPIANGYSPSELLMGRKLRTIVPILPQQLQPKLPNTFALRRKEQHIKEKQKQTYNKRHRVTKLTPLKKGNRVWLPQMGKKGTVIKQQGIRSYLIKTDDGGMYRRNRKHLNTLPETEMAKTDNEKTKPDAVPPIPSSPVTMIPIPNSTGQSNNQTRSGRVIRLPSRYRDLPTT